MQKDFKIGMLLGLILVIVAVLWLSTRPSLSTKARIQNFYNAGSQQDSTEHPNTPLTGPAAATDGLQSTNREQNAKIKIRRFHIVREGETLSGISQEYYGSENKWQKILDANRKIIKDANRLKPGTKLTIPE